MSTTASLALLAAVLLGIAASAVLARYANVLDAIHGGKSPEVFAERAREVIHPESYWQLATCPDRVAVWPYRRDTRSSEVGQYPADRSTLRCQDSRGAVWDTQVFFALQRSFRCYQIYGMRRYFTCAI